MLQAMFSRVRQRDREGGEGEVLWCVEKTGHVWLGFYVGPIGPHPPRATRSLSKANSTIAPSPRTSPSLSPLAKRRQRMSERGRECKRREERGERREVREG